MVSEADIFTLPILSIEIALSQRTDSSLNFLEDKVIPPASMTIEEFPTWKAIEFSDLIVTFPSALILTCPDFPFLSESVVLDDVTVTPPFEDTSTDEDSPELLLDSDVVFTLPLDFIVTLSLESIDT